MAERKQFQAIKGVRDILPPDTALWNWFEQTARQVLESYNFREIRLPIFEETELFARSVGENTDIVSKEMYTFEDHILPGFEADREALLSADIMDPESLVNFSSDLHFVVGRLKRVQADGLLDEANDIRVGELAKLKSDINFDSLIRRLPRTYDDLRNAMEEVKRLVKTVDLGRIVTLRPEATASVVRAYVEHGMHTWAGLAKLYYLGPMFRREKPQKGRYRQFYQIGAEVLGTSEHPAIDAEVIEMLIVLLERCRLECWTLFINSIGCKECRPAYVVKLREALLKVKAKLGPDSQRRIETNPLRVLDSKLPEEQAIIEKLPRITEHLCADCREHFAAVQEQLKLRGIPYEVNWRLVRGLDYYMRTTFEITSSALGAQNALVGGGRYDGLVELLGGPAGIKGIGFALGEDRFIEVIKDAGKVAAERPADVFIAWIPSDRGISRIYETAVKLARRLRAENLTVELPVEEAKLKKSLGLADKLGARYAVLLGEDEIASGSYILRRMADGEQKKLRESELVDYLKSESARNAVARR